jgi:hypothetical protein
MRLKNTIILLVLAGAAYFFLRYYESQKPTTEEAEEISGHVVQVDADKVDGVTITNNDTKIELRKRDNEWQMDAPVKDRADGAVVATLLSTVESLEKETSLKADGGKEDVRDLGLAKPNVTLQLLGENAPPAILFGKDTAMEGQEYVRLANSDEIDIVASDVRNQLTKPVDDYRDHQLSNLATTQVNNVDIKTPGGEIELAKDHDHWQINKPIKARGDDSKIADLVSQTLTAKIDSFVPADQAAAANTALGDEAGDVTFTAEGVDKPAVVQFSKQIDKQPGKVYAKLSTRDADFVVSGSSDNILGTKPNDVRDPHLIRLDLNIVDRIHVQPAGAPEILLARKGEDWAIKTLNDRPANNGAVQALATTLQNQLVTAFVSDVAADLPKYGLDNPQIKVTFSSYASDNTAETKAGEEPIETILFGKVDGDNVYAKLDDEPFIVSVSKNILLGIYADPLKWQTLTIFNLKPADITSLDVARDGQGTISLVQMGGVWKPAKGDIKLNTDNIQSIVSCLVTLTAADWSDAAPAKAGMGKLEETLTFTTADKQSHSVKIGAATGDYSFASASGFDGTFLMTKPNHDTLSMDVLPSASPEPSIAAPTVTGTDRQ